ncbi:MAG: PHP domain-containing protein [Ignavibacteria bacterium]|nr:PHP domain-containing protein [Ignavibacteria bacterium]
MLKKFMADLHIHSCLSPCGELSMTPQKIINEAKKKQLDFIAVSDHNSAENISAILNVAEKNSLTVIPAMEICSIEEVHTLALFRDLDSVLEMQSIVYNNLKGKNNPDVFGLQVIGNENDEVEGFVDKLLIGATELSVDEIVNQVHTLDGLAIASHIDRESYSVISQLGFIPQNLEYDALEISSNISVEEARNRFAEYSVRPFIRNSDAHKLEDIAKCTTQFFIEEPSFDEVKKAFKNIGGRSIGIN